MSTKPRRIDGVDLSHHNPVSLDALRKAKAAGVRFLWHKATEGATVVDRTYAERRKLAAEAGIPFGAYHFARPGKGDAELEARHFLATAKPKPGDLRPALDLETTEGLTITQLRAWAAEWVAVVRKATGVEPVVYSPWDLGTKGLRWRPRYNYDNRPPVLPWDLWQFSNGQLGKPDTVAGLGRVDLNTLAPGVTLAKLRIPQEPKPAPPTKVRRIRVGHASMQFSDTPEQMRQDVAAIFGRAKAKGLAWITGTEAGAGADTLDKLLREAAKAHGYRYFRPRRTDAWIAVREDLITGGWRTHYKHVIDGKARKWAAKGAVGVTFNTAELGTITVLAAHYLTKGRPNAKDPAYGVNLAANQALAHAIDDLARASAKGSALAFYGGDQNIDDRRDDTFLGGGFVSIGDELRKWPNTGHGPIDVIARWRRDGRVKPVAWDVYPDSELKLHTDHYLIEATYDVRVVRKTTSSAR